MYQFQCKGCSHPFDSFTSLENRDQPTRFPCKLCGGEIRRVFSLPHNAPIPGQYNRVNRHWDESGIPVEQRYSDLMLPEE